MLLLQIQEDNDTEWFTLNRRDTFDGEDKAYAALVKLRQQWRATVENFANANFRIIDAKEWKVSNQRRLLNSNVTQN